LSSTFAQQRRTLLEALAGELPGRGLASRMLGGDHPMLWVWNPRTGSQTIVFASPANTGWVFLWSPDGQEGADDTALAADQITKLLSRTG
jgi:hypothetical protein